MAGTLKDSNLIAGRLLTARVKIYGHVQWERMNNVRGWRASAIQKDVTPDALRRVNFGL